MSQNQLPKWHGFNLLNLFSERSYATREEEFQWISDWGFNFVRLPTNYWLYTVDKDPYQLDESKIMIIDSSLEAAQKNGLHLNLNIHRGPGYCINQRVKEPYNLWKDQEALDAFSYQWSYFTQRYAGVSAADLSFNLINEPPVLSESFSIQDHDRVMGRIIREIHAQSPQRKIILDGYADGNGLHQDLRGPYIYQSTRGYLPMGISHYGASWVINEAYFPPPQWPGAWATIHDHSLWGATELRAHYQKWIDLKNAGVGVHCGECGCYSETPHRMALDWLKTVFDILDAEDIGFALWNFKGSFGILNSQRKDVDYEDWYGLKLDRQLLELMQSYL